MARKLTFTFALLVLVTLFTGATFATTIPTQITFGPNTTGNIAIGTSTASFSSLPAVTGAAYQGATSGQFSLGGGSVGVATGHAPLLLPNPLAFTFNFGPQNTLSGWLTLDTMIDLGKYGTFFGGTYSITGSSWALSQTGFPVGALVLADFTVQRNGLLSSGELAPDPVPEPGTIALVGSGLLAAAGMLRRKI